METCFIIITNDCNNSCSYCINNNNKENIYSEYQNVAFDKYKKLIKELREIKFSDVVITGGEPLLYPEINRLIEEIHKNGLTSTLITNGEKLDDHSLDKLKKSGLNNLTLSLNNFANPGMLEINEIIKNYSKKIKLIEKYFNKICLNFILTAANYNYCNKIYDKFGKNINQFLMISPIAIEQNNKLYDKLSLTKLTEKNWKTLKEKLSDWMIKNNTYTYIQLIHNYFTKFKTEHLSCYMGSNSMVVDVFGNVFPCFYRKDLFLGNINRNNTKDIFFNCLHKSNELINSNCLCEKCIPLFINYV